MPITPPPPNIDTLPDFKRLQDELDYVGFCLKFDQSKLWNNNIPPIVDHMLHELGTCSELGPATVLGRINVLKSLFFSRLPYFLEMLPLPTKDSHYSLNVLQAKFNNIAWNGRKPKMKLENAALPQTQGGLGMIDVVSRVKALKINLIQRACNTIYLTLWQAHLFSKFNIPFDLLIRANIPKQTLHLFLVSPLPSFWLDTLNIWFDFHYEDCKSTLSDSELEEVINRPVFLNNAFGSPIPRKKRYTEELEEFYIQIGWFSVWDIFYRGIDHIPQAGYISRHLAVQIMKSVPRDWKQYARHNPKTDVFTIGQKIIDQKFALRDIYLLILNRMGSFQSTIAKWNQDGIDFEWTVLANNVQHLINGSLKNFFILFNSRSFLLNIIVCHFAPVSEFCSFCKFAKETYFHLFWECPKVQNVWRFIHSLVLRRFATPQMSLLPTGPHKVVFLFTLCKHYIHTCRVFHHSPSVYALKQKGLFHLKALKAYSPYERAR